MKETFGKFGVKTENIVEPVSPEKAARLASVHPELVGLIASYVVALDGKEVEWLNPDVSDLEGHKRNIETMLKALNIHLAPSEGAEDVFETFLQSFRDRTIR
jgi:hypothetical protein